MYNIFISYRRDASADIAGRIFDYLTQPFGLFLQTEVFMDVHGIPPDVNFKKYLEDRVQQCAVCLVIIGPRWADITDANSKRRLDNPADYVRIEVETALRRNIPVIPLLVMGNTHVPSEDQLPASLAELPYMNGLPVRRDPDFRSDIDKLTKHLQEMLQTARPSGTIYFYRHTASGPGCETYPFAICRSHACSLRLDRNFKEEL